MKVGRTGLQKLLGIVFLTCLVHLAAFDNASDFFGNLEVEKQEADNSRNNSYGAAEFPALSEQSNKDRWTAAAIAAKEAGVYMPQGQADVLQSIYNRMQSGNYNCNSVSECVNTEGQYEPTFNNQWEWKSIIDIHTAAKAAKLSLEQIKYVDTNLQKFSLQKEAARFIQCRTDFNGETEKPYMQSHNGDITRGKGHNFFGNFYPNSGNGSCF